MSNVEESAASTSPSTNDEQLEQQKTTTTTTTSSSTTPSSSSETAAPSTDGPIQLAPHQPENQIEIDSRSVYVGNVEFSTTPNELNDLFSPVGVVNRVTILCNKYNGRPKGYAYVEFEKEESVQLAIEQLNGKESKGRPVTVAQKRTNVPGLGKRERRGGFRGRFRGGYRGSRGGRGGRGGYYSYGGSSRYNSGDSEHHNDGENGSSEQQHEGGHENVKKEEESD
ncbi:unnamed protein product [Ambrosiozyma monospora]|uniref:Unnamed protein product n=1 Tax=Ambrosiozyma monospora TaxID=43982 RepID=A0A9W6SUV8_AMBMO|nr:unnamed protein product [Ambrosiozyma monospora]